MDKIQNALEFSKYRQTLNLHIDQAKHHFINSLNYAENGGIFAISMDLIAYVDMLIRLNVNSAILLDKNNLPIEILNLSHFKDKILTKYKTALGIFKQEYEKLKIARDVDSILDLED